MTKSFTALAILKLRDDGKLSLEDPVSKWIPEFARMELPTRDTPPLTVRQLMSHSAGFPEDNPWGDQQLERHRRGARRVARAPAFRSRRRPARATNIPTTPSDCSDASSRRPPACATSATCAIRFCAAEDDGDDVRVRGSARSSSRAIGYRLKPDGTYAEEPPLPHGVFGAMGGLLTTATDLGKYVAFHLSAWPPRDDAEAGPVRRASVREMAHLWTPANLTARYVNGAVQASQSGYGYGLARLGRLPLRTDRVARRRAARLRLLHAVAAGLRRRHVRDGDADVFGTVAADQRGVGRDAEDAAACGSASCRQRRCRPRCATTSSTCGSAGTIAEAKQIAAVNFLLDAPAAQRQAEIRALKNEVGECTTAGRDARRELAARAVQHEVREGNRRRVLHAGADPAADAVQHLAFRKLASDTERMGAPTGAPAGVSCSP